MPSPRQCGYPINIAEKPPPPGLGVKIKEKEVQVGRQMKYLGLAIGQPMDVQAALRPFGPQSDGRSQLLPAACYRTLKGPELEFADYMKEWFDLESCMGPQCGQKICRKGDAACCC
jgi:hypothetical protein